MFYIRRTKLTRNGKTPILMRLTINGCRIDTYVKKTILPEYWSATKGKAVEKTDYCRQLNLYLDSVKMRLMKIQREMEIDGELINTKTILDRYLGKDTPERHTLIEVFNEHNAKCRALSGIDMSSATVERYETSLKHTQEFMLYTYKKDDIYLDEISRQFIEDYEFYLKTVRSCNHNSTTKYLKNFKKITRTAIQKDWLQKDPFADIRFSLQPVEREFLEMHEIEKIRSKDIKIERLELVRDVFIFCCFTGFAFSDVKQLSSDHISIDINGARWIRKPRQKTKNMCNVPLMDVAQEILNKYRDNPTCKLNNVLLPVLVVKR